MSFLNSVLSSIGGPGSEASKVAVDNRARPVANAANNVPSKAANATQVLSSSPASSVVSLPARSSIPLQPALSGPRAPSGLKRKADALPMPPPTKLQRIEPPGSHTKSPPLPSHHKTHPHPSVNTSLGRSLTSHTASLSPSAQHTKAVIPSGKAPAQRSRDTLAVSSSAAHESHLRPAVKDPSIQGQPPKAPARGSYKEIMARAEAAKAAQAEFGMIKHKPVPKLSKSARKAQEEAAAAVTQQQNARGTARPGHGKSRTEKASGANAHVSRSEEQAVDQKKKIPVDLGYKGTMRPTTNGPEHRGTTKPATVAPSRTQAQPKSSVPVRPPDKSSDSKRYTYANYSDEEDEEDEDDYDEESDMEAAGFDDLMNEEEESLKYAKKEDQEALAEENALRKAKEERRNKLTQLAASRRR